MKKSDLALVVLVTVLWGINFPVIKMAVEEFPPLLFISIRLLATGILLAPFANLPRWDNIIPILKISVVLGSLHFFFLIFGLRYAEAGYITLIYQTNVIFGFVFAILFMNEICTRIQGIGLCIALGGSFIVLSGSVEASTIGTFFGFVAAALFGLGQCMVKGMKDTSPITINSWMSIFSGIQVIILSLILELEIYPAFSSVGVKTWMGLLYMSLVSGGVAYTIWYIMIKRYGIVRITPFNLLTPGFSIIASYFLLGENFNPTVIAGGVLLILGIGIVSLNKTPSYTYLK